MKGYYGPSIAMSRIVFESWLHGVFLNLYPELIEDWKAYKTRAKPKDMRHLVATKMGLDEKLLSKTLDDFYSDVSEISYLGLRQ